MWQVAGWHPNLREFTSLAAAKKAVQRRQPGYKWSRLLHGPDGRLYTVGRRQETDDQIVIKQSR